MTQPPSSAPDTAFPQALAHFQAGRLPQARELLGQILKKYPRHAESLHLLGVIAYQSAEPREAEQLIVEAIRLAPRAAAFHSNLALALRALGRDAEALARLDAAIALAPDFAAALTNRGELLLALSRPLDALVDFDRLARLHPQHAPAHLLRAKALELLGRWQEAVEACDRAVEIAPDLLNALNRRGNLLCALGHHEQALLSYEQAMAHHPGAWAVLNNRGNALLALQRLQEALSSYEQALTLKPDYADAWGNRANVLIMLGRRKEAVLSYDKALALRPDDARTWQHRGNVLSELHRLEDALASYARAFALKPDDDYLLGSYLHCQASLCDWRVLEAGMARLAQAVNQGQRLSVPFPVLGLLDDPRLQQRSAAAHVSASYPNAAAPVPPRRRPGGDRIRIGYYSADFHDHATAYLMAQLFEAHDRERFEIVAFSYGADRRDTMRARLSAAFSQFLDVRTLTDQEVVALSRERGIDIAVDLKGHTREARLGIFAGRCAPLQVNYLGHPGTSGAAFIDYIVADATVLPDELKDFFTERVVRLPRCYQPNDAARAVSAQTPERAACGLPDSGFVFCCFNNNYKILPAVFEVWMQILRATPGSVLWLLQDNAAAAGHLAQEAAARGIDPARLVFAPRIPAAEHLARQRLADLFLDTWPCNAHTTASDALWVGLPVLTLQGRSFAARVASSLLEAVGLPQLITRDASDYASLAIRLAKEPQRLHALRTHLTQTARTSALFDGAGLARDLEAAYEAMLARAEAGLPPADIDIAAAGGPAQFGDGQLNQS